MLPSNFPWQLDWHRDEKEAPAEEPAEEPVHRLSRKDRHHETCTEPEPGARRASSIQADRWAGCAWGLSSLCCWSGFGGGRAPLFLRNRAQPRSPICGQRMWPRMTPAQSGRGIRAHRQLRLCSWRIQMHTLTKVGPPLEPCTLSTPRREQRKGFSQPCPHPSCEQDQL